VIIRERILLRYAFFRCCGRCIQSFILWVVRYRQCEYLFVSELKLIMVTSLYIWTFFDMSFERLNPASQFESCLAWQFASSNSWTWRFLEHEYFTRDASMRWDLRFTVNLLMNLSVKEFWKSVKIWLRYRREFDDVFLFWNTVYHIAHLWLYSYVLATLLAQFTLKYSIDNSFFLRCRC